MELQSLDLQIYTLKGTAGVLLKISPSMCYCTCFSESFSLFQLARDKYILLLFWVVFGWGPCEKDGLRRERHTNFFHNVLCDMGALIRKWRPEEVVELEHIYTRCDEEWSYGKETCINKNYSNEEQKSGANSMACLFRLLLVCVFGGKDALPPDGISHLRVSPPTSREGQKTLSASAILQIPLA